MSTNTKTAGKIDEIINTNCMTIHGLPFTVHDLIQTMLYLSESMGDVIMNTPSCNAYNVTFVPEQGVLVGTPVQYNKSFYNLVLKTGEENASKMKELDKFPSPNEYEYFEDGELTMVLTKGYMIDNFDMCTEGLHDFTHEDTPYSIVIRIEDLESLSVKNPDMEI